MDFIQSFVNFLEEKEKSKNTINTYIIDTKQFLEFYSDDLILLTKENIEQFEQYLTQKGLKITSINRKLVTLNQFIYFLNDKYDLGITVSVKQKKRQRQDYLDEMLDKNDFDKLVAATVTNNDTRAKAIFYTLYLTGVRVSEMLQLTIDDIKKEYISVRGKGDKYRQIFVPTRVRTAWIEYVPKRTETSDKLFTGQKGAINRQTVHNIIKKYAKLSGVSESAAHAHNFRHLYCKTLVDKGYDISLVADLAGHSDVNTTRIYTRKTRSELLAAVNEL